MNVMMKGLCLTATLALGGCLTPVGSYSLATSKATLEKHAQWQPPSLNVQMPTQQPLPNKSEVRPNHYPLNMRGIQLDYYEKSGAPKVMVSRWVSNNSKILSSTLHNTLSGNEKGGTRLGLVYPRSDSFALGTILRSPIKEGGEFHYDTSIVEQYKHTFQQEQIGSSLLSGMIENTTWRMLLLPDNRLELQAEFSNPEKKFLRFSTIVNVRSAQVEVLPKYAAERIIQKHLLTPQKDSKQHYFIADKLIWAKEVAYFFGPAQVLGNPKNKIFGNGLDPKEIATAKQSKVNVQTQNGVTVISETFEEPRIVAVGFSIFPGATDVGDRMIGNGHQPTLADLYYVKAKPTTLTK
ncbi:MAG: hypothetical protein OQK24_02230 [Magnetovibrio sp.]|nr:hypothetical protein [Magnetovibrio sp.]